MLENTKIFESKFVVKILLEGVNLRWVVTSHNKIVDLDEYNMFSSGTNANENR